MNVECGPPYHLRPRESGDKRVGEGLVKPDGPVCDVVDPKSRRERSNRQERECRNQPALHLTTTFGSMLIGRKARPPSADQPRSRLRMANRLLSILSESRTSRTLLPGISFQATGTSARL